MWRITCGALALAMTLAASAYAQEFLNAAPSAYRAQQRSYAMATVSQFEEASTVQTQMTAIEARTKGLTDAPALLKAAGIDCQLADARFVGETKGKPKEDFYEIACTNSLGFIIAKTSLTDVATATCLEMARPVRRGKPNALQCSLPGNANPELELLPYISKARADCTPLGVRFIGHSATQTAFEVACHGGAGYILITTAPPRLDRPMDLEPCIAIPAKSALECKLTTSNAEAEIIDQLAAKSGKNCDINARAYIGSTEKDGATYYEVTCAGGKGYILEQARNGSLAEVIDCAKAEHIIPGGCESTSTSEAKALQATAYSRMAKAANFNCDVSKYAYLPATSDGKDVVELGCSNRPDGGIGLVSGSSMEPVIDCAYARFFGYSCILSDVSAVNITLTNDLKSLGEKNCIVSDARPMGITAERHGFTEVSCTGHHKGYVIEYNLESETPISVLSCAAATRIGNGCRLPGDME